MADDMEEVRQRFEADMADYITAVNRGAAEARKLAEGNEAAVAAIDSLRDKTVEAALAMVAYSDELGKVRDKAAEAAVAVRGLKDEEDKAARGGLLSRLFGAGGGGSSGGGGGGISGLFSSIKEGGFSLTNPYVIAGIAASLPMVITELAGLVSGFAAAGAGAGAFYLLAHPAISNLTADISSLDSANQALGIAQQKYLIDPTKANAAALQKAQLTYQATYQQMGQDAGGAAAGVLQLHDEYVKLSNAFQPQVFKIFNDLLRVANTLLPHITPFADAFATSLDGLLKNAGKFAGSNAFKQWLEQFQRLTGPSLTAIGVGIGHLVVSFGKLMTVMSAKDVVNAINIAFSILNGTLIAVTEFVKLTMHAWDMMTSAFTIGRHEIAGVFDQLRHDAAQWAGDVRHDTDIVTGWFQQLPGRILHALGDLGRLLWNAGVQIVEGFVGGIESMGGAVGNALLSLIPGPVRRFASFLGIGSPSRVFHEFGVNTLQGYIDGVKSMAPQVLAALHGVGGQIASGGLGPAAGSYAAAAVNVTVPLTLMPGTQGYNDPRFTQYLQTAVQEAILRYQQNNPGNGLSSAWGTR